jgi:hypothetical protein
MGERRTAGAPSTGSIATGTGSGFEGRRKVPVEVHVKLQSVVAQKAVIRVL